MSRAEDLAKFKKDLTTLKGVVDTKLKALKTKSILSLGRQGKQLYNKGPFSYTISITSGSILDLRFILQKYESPSGNNRINYYTYSFLRLKANLNAIQLSIFNMDKELEKIHSIFFHPPLVSSFNVFFLKCETVMNEIPKLHDFGLVVRNKHIEVLQSTVAGLLSFIDTFQTQVESYVAKAILWDDKTSLASLKTQPFYLGFMNMQQGDCTLIKTPGGKRIMIDCGSHGVVTPNHSVDYKKVQDAIKSGWFLNKKRSIDYLILTHSDTDHHNKLRTVLGSNISIGCVLHSNEFRHYGSGKMEEVTTGNDGTGALEVPRPIKKRKLAPYKTSTWIQQKCTGNIGQVFNQNKYKKNSNNPEVITKIIDSIGDGKELIGLHTLDQNNGNGMVIIDEGLDNNQHICKITILASNVTSQDGNTKVKYSSKGTAENQKSIVTLIETYGKKILIGGDATTTTEDFLLDRYKGKQALQNINLTTASHHGADTSSSKKFVKAIQPKGFIVSAGYGSKHHHPRKAIIDRFRNSVVNSKLDKKATEHEIYFYSGQANHWNISDGNKTEDHFFITGKNGNRKYHISPGGHPTPDLDFLPIP